MEKTNISKSPLIESKEKEMGTNAKTNKAIAFLSSPKLAPVRKLLSFIVIFVSLYILIAPIYPELEYRFRKQFLNQDGDRIEIIKKADSKDGKENYSIKKDEGEEQEIKDNMVIIPKIGVAMEIGVGEDEKILDQGKAWLRPNTSNPENGSNTVLTAHRFQYMVGKNTFYNLDKLSSGDEVKVYWKGKLYEYVVQKSFEVTPDKIEVEAPSDAPMLTLYTCTPVFTSTNRLVVTAIPK